MSIGYPPALRLVLLVDERFDNALVVAPDTQPRFLYNAGMHNLSTPRVIRMAVGGAIGGIVTFLIVNPSASSFEREVLSGRMSLDRLMRHLQGRYAEVLLLGLAIGISIGLALIVAEELQTPKIGRIAVLMLYGVIAGGVCGAVGAVIAQAVFTAMGGEGSWVGRIVGWAIMGAGAGICPGAATFSVQRAKLGVIGGLIGGAVGGALFDPIAMLAAVGGSLTAPGALSRAVGFLVTGAAIGAAVALVEEYAKEYWLTVLTGAREGRSYILTKNQTTIGRDERADIPLFGDQAVQRLHARVVKDDRAAHVVPYAPGAVAINSQPVAGAPLSDGDIISIGKHRLRFSSRHAVPSAYAAYQPPYQVPQQPPQPTVQAAAAVTRLDVIVGPHAGETYILSASPTVIGRDFTCAILLGRDVMVSRRHAVLVRDAFGWRIDDAGSTNGVYVNGQRVTSRILQAGDQIGVGQSVMRAM